MKKYVFCLIIALSLSLTGYAQSIDQLLKKVSKTENVDKVKVGGFLLSIAKMSGEMKDVPGAKGIDGLEVYDLSSCDASFKKSMIKEFQSIKDGNGYETLMLAKDKEDSMRIMIKKEKDKIKEMVFLCIDKKDPAIIRISGKIAEEDIAKLTNSYNK